MQASTFQGSLDDLRPRTPERLSGPALLALAAHALLVIALSFAVNWHTQEPDGIEAELWAAVPRAAAPRPVDPPPVAAEQLPPTPVQQPKPEPTPAPPNRDADIAREKLEDKQRKEQQQEQQRQEAAQKRRDAEQQKADQLKAAEQKKADDAKRDADQLAQQKKADAARQAKVEADRQNQLKRILGQAGATGDANATGTAAQSAGPSTSYGGRVSARIKPNITLLDEVSGNPAATVEVRVAPDGSIVGRRLVQSSGVAAWDDAVLKAVDKTAVLPLDGGRPPPPAMVLVFKPQDL